MIQRNYREEGRRDLDRMAEAFDADMHLLYTVEIQRLCALALIESLTRAGLRKVDAILFGTSYEDWLEASPERRSDLTNALFLSTLSQQ